MDTHVFVCQYFHRWNSDSHKAAADVVGQSCSKCGSKIATFLCPPNCLVRTTFPVLWQGSRKYKETLTSLGCPRSIPWAFIARFREGCERNHDQTPERLAERGGLAPEEILAVMVSTDASARLQAWHLPPEETVPRLLKLLAEFQSEQVAVQLPPLPAEVHDARYPSLRPGVRVTFAGDEPGAREGLIVRYDRGGGRPWVVRWDRTTTFDGRCYARTHVHLGHELRAAATQTRPPSSGG